MIIEFTRILLISRLVLFALCDFEDSEILDLPNSFEWDTNLTYGFKFRTDRDRLRIVLEDPLDFNKTGCVR